METNQNNIESESDWETEEEDYIRLKIENITRIKQKFNSFGKNKLMKVKKMDKENYKRITNCNMFLNESVYPNMRLLQPPKFKSDSGQIGDKEQNLEECENQVLGDLRHLNHLLLNKEVFNVAKKPEIGSLMIFEIENKGQMNSNVDAIGRKETQSLKELQQDGLELVFKGVSTEFYDSSNKVILPRKLLLEYLPENQDKIIGNVNNKHAPIAIKDLNDSNNNEENFSIIAKNFLEELNGLKTINQINHRDSKPLSANQRRVSEIPSVYSAGKSRDKKPNAKANVGKDNDKDTFLPSANIKNRSAKKQDKIIKSEEFDFTDKIGKGNFQFSEIFDSFKNNFDENQQEEIDEEFKLGLNEYESENSAEAFFKGSKYEFDAESRGEEEFEAEAEYVQQYDEGVNNKTELYSDLIEIENREDKQNYNSNKRKRNSNVNADLKNFKSRRLENQDDEIMKTRSLNNFNTNDDKVFEYFDGEEKCRQFEKRKIVKNGTNGKRRKRKKFNYKKNSTIIEIKKIN